jgi:predicted ATPase
MLKNLLLADFCNNCKEADLKFRSLAKVNYLVGENASGKTRALKTILKKYKKSFLIQDGISELKIRRVFSLDAVLISTRRNKNLELYNKAKNEFHEEAFFVLKNIYEIKKTDFDSGGYEKLFALCLLLLHLIKNQSYKIFLIEEPEIHLHPKIQKHLPNFFQYFAKKYNVQFFLSTHSPFVISEVGELTETEKDLFEIVLPKRSRNKKNFQPSQKVYFLKESQLANKRGYVSTKGNFGYWGNKVNHISNKMLGVGLIDLISPQPTSSSKSSPKLVFCEGEGNGNDAKIYNTIFKDLKPPTLFVSCRGNSQLHKSFRLIKEIKPGLSADFEVLMVRDRDHEFPKLEDILNYENTNEGCKVLRRRAIELYIFNTEVAEEVLKKHDLKLNKKSRNKLHRILNQTKRQTEKGITGNEYKDKLWYAFVEAIKNSGYNLNPQNKDLRVYLSKYITPQTKVYKELYEIIFG